MGKAWSVNHVLPRIQHEYILIVDADTYLERKFIEKLQHALVGHNYELGSGFAKYIGRNKFAKKLAKIWVIKEKDSWRFNGCCQFFRTDLLRREGYNEECLVEDEEIYWRLQHKKEMLVDAVAYSETPPTPKAWVKQQLRWMRGAYQLARWNFTKSLKHKYKQDILASLVYPFIPLMLLTLNLLSPSIISIIGTTILFFFLMYNAVGSIQMFKHFHYLLVDMFLPLYVFFEVFIFNRKFKVPKAW